MFNSDMGVCDSRETDNIMKDYFDRSQAEWTKIHMFLYYSLTRARAFKIF